MTQSKSYATRGKYTYLFVLELHPNGNLKGTSGTKIVKKFAVGDSEEIVGIKQSNNAFFFMTFLPTTDGGTLFVNRWFY